MWSLSGCVMKKRWESMTHQLHWVTLHMMMLAATYVNYLVSQSNATDMFSAYISACSTIDKGVMSQMCNAFATQFGPSPFLEMMAELQCKHHVEHELMYFNAACHYSLHGALQVPSFSMFSNKLWYWKEAWLGNKHWEWSKYLHCTKVGTIS